jgi:carbon monoxide dehydrogenase subunit G
MASVYREFDVDAPVGQAWAAVADVGAVYKLVTLLGDVTLDGDRRTCELGDGMGTLEELITSVDEEHRRLSYSIQKSPFDFEHHHASMQVFENDAGGSRIVWAIDFKPDAAEPQVAGLIDTAAETIKQSLGS